MEFSQEICRIIRAITYAVAIFSEILLIKANKIIQVFMTDFENLKSKCQLLVTFHTHSSIDYFGTSKNKDLGRMA